MKLINKINISLERLLRISSTHCYLLKQKLARSHISASNLEQWQIWIFNRKKAMPLMNNSSNKLRLITKGLV